MMTFEKNQFYYEKLIDKMSGRKINDSYKKIYFDYIITYPEEMCYVDRFEHYEEYWSNNKIIETHLFHALKKGRKLASLFFDFDPEESPYEPKLLLIIIPERVIYGFRDFYEDEPENELTEDEFEMYFKEVFEIHGELNMERKKERIDELEKRWINEGIVLSDTEIAKGVPALKEPYTFTF